MRLSISSALSTLIPVVFATCFTPASSVLADDLFSGVALEAVFENGNDSSDSNSSTNDNSNRTQRVTGAGSLVRVLDSAGLAATKVDRSVVSVTLRQAGLSLPVLMSVAVEENRLDMVMLLAEFNDDSDWDTARLAQLFTANSEESTLFFAISKTRRRVELRRSMSNRWITPAVLKEELNKMALVAETYEDTWSNVAINESKTDKNVAESKSQTQESTTIAAPNSQNQASTTAGVGATTTAPAQSAPTQSAPAKPPTGQPARLTLVGQWSASLSTGEAFAVMIARSGQFQLVHVKSGKTTVSKGTAARSGNQLTLTDTSGTIISGTVTQTRADAFSLAIGGNAAAALQFKRAK